MNLCCFEVGYILGGTDDNFINGEQYKLLLRSFVVAPWLYSIILGNCQNGMGLHFKQIQLE